MKVSAQHAKTHLSDLLSAAKTGEEIEIAHPDQSSFCFTLIKPAPAKPNGPRILGAGRGEMVVPSWAEWKAMDKEIESEMCDAPFISSADRNNPTA